MDLSELRQLIKNHEYENVEIKEWKNSIPFDGQNKFENRKCLLGYCVAIGNEGGGKLIIGVSDDGTITGTKSFLAKDAKKKIYDQTGQKIEVQEVYDSTRKVLVINIPGRPIGQTYKFAGTPLMRVDDSLEPMNDAEQTRILLEKQNDFSAEIVPQLTIQDLDGDAISELRSILKKHGKNDLLKLNNERLLESLELTVDQKITYACLILLGKKEILRVYLPTFEIIFEWRQDAKKITHDFRGEWQSPFLNIYNEVWNTITARNIRIPIQEGLIQSEILAFNESAIRESVLNAVAHRDYSIISQSVFIHANPENFVIASPGGLLPGITPQNILFKQASRNRRIAEVFQKLGLVERSGQGMDQIFESTIRDGKGLPDLSRSDEYEVVLRIPAQVKDKNFILFLEKISREKQITFSLEDIIELELLRENGTMKDLKCKEKFLKLGIIEKIGKTSGSKYILSHHYYKHEDRVGEYTRLKGISREHKKQLIMEHIKREKKGSRNDFIKAFPELKPKDVSNLLQELKNEKLIKRAGSIKSGYWIKDDITK